MCVRVCVTIRDMCRYLLRLHVPRLLLLPHTSCRHRALQRLLRCSFWFSSSCCCSFLSLCIILLILTAFWECNTVHTRMEMWLLVSFSPFILISDTERSGSLARMSLCSGKWLFIYILLDYYDEWCLWDLCMDTPRRSASPVLSFPGIPTFPELCFIISVSSHWLCGLLQREEQWFYIFQFSSF